MEDKRSRSFLQHVALSMLLAAGATLLPAGAHADWLYEYDGQVEEAVYAGSFYQVPGQLGPLTLRLSLIDSYVPGTPFTVEAITGVELHEPNITVSLEFEFGGGQMPVLVGEGILDVSNSAISPFRFPFGPFVWSVDIACPPSVPDCDGGYFATGSGGPWFRVDEPSSWALVLLIIGATLIRRWSEPLKLDRGA
jgi:hypothetical protein